MSDELNTAPAPTEAAPQASDVSATPDAAPSDPYAGLDVEGMFGLSAENGPPAEPDVPTAADSPGTHPAENDAAITSPEADASDASQTAVVEEETTGFKFNDKLNWENGNKDAQAPFREEYQNLKKAYTDLLGSSVEGQYLTQPAEFAQWMKETSPTSFNEVGGIIATESAQLHPDKWIEFLAQTPANADLMAKKLSGREDMTADRLKAELEVILDTDDPEVQAAMERQKAESANTQKPTVETPEQKRLREVLERDDRRIASENLAQVFGPINKAVNGLISQAGLEVDLDSTKLQDFSKLDADTQFKVAVNMMAPFWIEQRINADPKLANMQARITECLKQGDVKTALNLQHPAQIAVTNAINELLTALTGQKAKVAKQESLPPTTDAPPPVVRSAGAGAIANGNGKGPVTADDWNVTEADLIRR